MYVHMPADCLGKAFKFIRPFKGPYRIIRLFANDAEVKLINKPQAGTIRVALNQVRRCPFEIKNPDPPAAITEVEVTRSQSVNRKCRQTRLLLLVSNPS